MKQLNLPMCIPVTKFLSKDQKRAEQIRRYNEIIFQKNEEYFYTQLKQLERVINQ